MALVETIAPGWCCHRPRSNNDWDKKWIIIRLCNNFISLFHLSQLRFDIWTQRRHRPRPRFRRGVNDLDNDPDNYPVLYVFRSSLLTKQTSSQRGSIWTLAMSVQSSYCPKVVCCGQISQVVILVNSNQWMTDKWKYLACCTFFVWICKYLLQHLSCTVHCTVQHL